MSVAADVPAPAEPRATGPQDLVSGWFRILASPPFSLTPPKHQTSKSIYRLRAKIKQYHQLDIVLNDLLFRALFNLSSHELIKHSQERPHRYYNAFSEALRGKQFPSGLLNSSSVPLLLKPTALISEREDGYHIETRVHTAEAAESLAKQLATGQM